MAFVVFLFVVSFKGRLQIKCLLILNHGQIYFWTLAPYLEHRFRWRDLFRGGIIVEDKTLQ